MKKLVAVICLLLFAMAVCQAQQNAKVMAKPVKAAAVAAPAAEFVLTYNDDAQTSKVVVKYGKKKVYIDSTAGKAELLQRTDYAAKGVPGKATACCHAWWAGTGTIYYIAKTSTGVAVYKGMEYEEGPAKAGQWKKIKEIKSDL